MLMAGSVGKRRMTGEVCPPRCKMGWNRASGADPAVEVAILLPQRLSPRHSAFRLDRNVAIVALIRGGWAVHVGNVG
jgi:hypothetical protein